MATARMNGLSQPRPPPGKPPPPKPPAGAPPPRPPQNTPRPPPPRPPAGDILSRLSHGRPSHPWQEQMLTAQKHVSQSPPSLSCKLTCVRSNVILIIRTTQEVLWPCMQVPSAMTLA